MEEKRYEAKEDTFMLMPKKRFRFNKAYLYGSGAFLIGYAAILTLLAHYAPVYRQSANIATFTQEPKVEKKAEQTTESSKTESTQGESKNTSTATRTPSASMTVPQTQSSSSTPENSTPVAPVDETPAVTDPVVDIPVVTDPEPTTPIIDLPGIDVTVDLN